MKNFTITLTKEEAEIVSDALNEQGKAYAKIVTTCLKKKLKDAAGKVMDKVRVLESVQRALSEKAEASK